MCVPTARLPTGSTEVPPVLVVVTATVPRAEFAVVSKKFTVPVSAGLPVPPAIVIVNVSVWPSTTVAAESPSVEVVEIGLTVTVCAVLVLP
jgi:hypothetical protein